VIDPLLASCARAGGHPLQLERLAEQVKGYTDWQSLPSRAEVNGLAPLVHLQLQSTGLAFPDTTRRVLAALTLRHRRANHIRGNALAEILNTFKQENIEILVLKGAALANTVYPQPGLRPMRDMDILVKNQEALRAQAKLVELGFNARVPASLANQSIHHLPIANRLDDGLTVSLELHYQLLPSMAHPVYYEELSPDASSFSVNGVAAQTLGHEDMLWHIYRHSFAPPLIGQPIRLIWMADFVSLVEKYVDEIDWGKLKYKYPQVWNILPAFHALTPWSDKVLNTLNMDIDPPLKGTGQTFQGWPQSSLAVQRNKGLRRFLGDTFWPSEWWLQLYYGLERRSPGWWWMRLIGHPLHIAGWVIQYLLERTQFLLDRIQFLLDRNRS